MIALTLVCSSCQRTDGIELTELGYICWNCGSIEIEVQSREEKEE